LLLLPEPVGPHLMRLPPDLRGQFLSEMALVGDALQAVTAALRINTRFSATSIRRCYAPCLPAPHHGAQVTANRPTLAARLECSADLLRALHGELKRRIAADITGSVDRA